MDIGDLRKIVGIKLLFEGPSDWSIREYINVIDEYLMERLPVVLNNVLEPYGLEASLKNGDLACKLLNNRSGCSDFLVAELYDSSGNSLCCYVIYKRRIGDNTYEFTLEDIVVP